MCTLINKTAVRDYILATAKDQRPGWRCERVSAAALEEVDLRLRQWLFRAVREHPTRGKTFKEIQR